MKRLLLIIPLILAVLVFAGFRTTGYRSGASYPGDFTFEGDLTVSGAVKPGVVFWEMMSNHTNDDYYLDAVHTAVMQGWFDFDGATSTDSIVIDSIRFVIYTDHNDVYIDSIDIRKGLTRDTVYIGTGDVVWGDGTDRQKAASLFAGYTYTSIGTFAVDWRPQIRLNVETTSAGGIGYLMSAKIYGHYQ